MKRLMGLGVLALMLFPAVGCVVHSHRRYGPPPPPPPRHEMRDRYQGRRVWVPAHYEWRGNRRVFVPGHWR